jgi:hypothetical protein
VQESCSGQHRDDDWRIACREQFVERDSASGRSLRSSFADLTLAQFPSTM